MYAAVSKVRAILVLVLKQEEEIAFLSLCMGVLPSPFSSHYISSNSSAVLSAGRWNSENSGECWFLLCREGILVLVFYAKNLSALRACCIPCTISALCSLVPQHLALSAPVPVHLNKHQVTYLSVSAALMPFCRHNKAKVSAICFWVLFLFIKNDSSSCCLSPSEPTEAMQGTEPGRQGAQQPVTTDPLCLQQPAGAPASPQLRHKANRQDGAAQVFLGNSFLHNPALRHLLFAAVQLRGRAHAEALEEQILLSLPSGRCPPYAMPLQSKNHSCASWDLCPPRVWPSFPWGTILHPLEKPKLQQLQGWSSKYFPWQIFKGDVREGFISPSCAMPTSDLDIYNISFYNQPQLTGTWRARFISFCWL